MVRLSREELESALQKGLGRALMHVRRHGDEGIEDFLSHAITCNLVYDSQSEGSRAKWLFEMIGFTGNATYYEDVLLEAVENVDEFWDADQMLELLKEYAERGSLRAKAAIYGFVDSGRFDTDWLGGEQLIELDGIEGFLHVADKIGAKLREDPDYWEDDSMLFQVQEQFGESEVNEALENRALESENISNYAQKIIRHHTGDPDREEIADETVEERRDGTRPKVATLEDILDDVDNGRGTWPGRYASFGRYTTAENIEAIARKLGEELREDQIVRLLWVFRKRRPPRLIGKLILLAQSESEEVRDAAIHALSNSDDGRIHDLFSLLASSPEWRRAAAAIKLLILNSTEGDGKNIEGILHRVPHVAEREDVHDIVVSLCRVAEKHDFEDLVDPMLWVYEHSPCMICRETAVGFLIARKALPESMRDECLNDACEGIRKQVGSRSS